MSPLPAADLDMQGADCHDAVTPIMLLPEDIMVVIKDMLVHDSTLIPMDKRGKVAHCPSLQKYSCHELGLDDQNIATRVLTFFGLRNSAIRLDMRQPFGLWADALHSHLRGRPDSIVFHSSGSMGQPVEHSLPFVLLEHEVRCVAPLLPARRIISVMPRHHCFAFVFSLLLARSLDLPALHFLPLPTKGFIDLLHERDLVVGFPFFWNALLRLNLPVPGIMPISAGSPCPGAVMDGLIRSGADGFREIYGASELGAVGYRHLTKVNSEKDVPFTLLPHWERENTAIAGSNGIARRLPEAMAKSVPEELLRPEYGQNGMRLVRCAPMPDILDWHDARTFRPKARKDKAVQVGSINVYPSRVAARLAAHPHVLECRVRLMRPEEGQRLKAFVVPQPGAMAKTALRAELIAWCRAALPSHAVPKTITFGKNVPLSAHGKDTDW